MHCANLREIDKHPWTLIAPDLVKCSVLDKDEMGITLAVWTVGKDCVYY
jgi:hypothetical protein